MHTVRRTRYDRPLSPGASADPRTQATAVMFAGCWPVTLMGKALRSPCEHRHPLGNGSILSQVFMEQWTYARETASSPPAVPRSLMFQKFQSPAIRKQKSRFILLHLMKVIIACPHVSCVDRRVLRERAPYLCRQLSMERADRKTGAFAASWVPYADLAGPDGCVAAEFVWASLDCPTAYSGVGTGYWGLNKADPIDPGVLPPGSTNARSRANAVLWWPGRQDETVASCLQAARCCELTVEVRAVAQTTWLSVDRQSNSAKANGGHTMTACGTKRTSGNVRPMSAFGREADIPLQDRDFRF